MIKSKIKIVKEEAELLLKKLEVKATIEVDEKDGFYKVHIQTATTDEADSESGILIGRYGETLQALQLILSLVVSKKAGEFLRLVLNVGDYREKREEKLKQLAHEAAAKAKETKQEVVLTNLSSWQRRVVHMELQEDAEVMTESQGEEPERYLVIKPK